MRRFKIITREQFGHYIQTFFPFSMELQFLGVKWDFQFFKFKKL